jgi:Flp pilus assembly pilin Flp
MRKHLVQRFRQEQRGQSTIEYTIVVAMAVLILIEGGASAPVAEVIAALKSAYQGFVYAISLASNLIAL